MGRPRGRGGAPEATPRAQTLRRPAAMTAETGAGACAHGSSRAPGQPRATGAAQEASTPRRPEVRRRRKSARSCAGSGGWDGGAGRSHRSPLPRARQRGRPAGGSGRRLCEKGVYRPGTAKAPHGTDTLESPDRCFRVAVRPRLPAQGSRGVRVRVGGREARGEVCSRLLRSRSVRCAKGHLYSETRGCKTDPDLFPSISN